MKTLMNKSKPRVGDEAWEVEWVSKMAFDENGDCDHDRCTESFRHFPTRDQALAFAVKTWPSTVGKFGIVEIMKVRFVAYDEDDAFAYPHAGFWESAGEVEVISDESGIPE